MSVPEVLSSLVSLDPQDSAYATRFVDQMLTVARQVGASDLHLQPTGRALDVRWRLDGVLQSVGEYPRGETADVISRLKVLANLLTYRSDVPQEGRIQQNNLSEITPSPLAENTRQTSPVEMRVSTFPTLHGERAVVRLFASSGKLQYLNDLGLPAEVHQQVQQLLAESSGAVIVAGPAGSGKTTTAYAMLRELVRGASGGRSIVSLEDPIETAVAGVAQCQVNEAAGCDLATGLRSLMRQDPEVILVGEIRDPLTARIAFQASLTGHLVVTTFHAGSAASAISRLSDMGIEPYLLRSGVLAIISQRLLRRLCDGCAVEISAADLPAARLGLEVQRAKRASTDAVAGAGATTHTKCPKCRGSGYQRRLVLAEMFTAAATEIGRAILSREDAPSLEQLAVSQGMVPLRRRACQAVEAGLTSPTEVRRVFGFG